MDEHSIYKLMSSVKSKNSKAELMVFSYLRKHGVYFQKHYTRALGKPDIALPRKKKAVFIDGDFWHGKDYKKREPQLNQYWREKVIKNMQRDKLQSQILRENGWSVIRVWESDINRKRTRETELQKIKDFLLS